MPLSENTGTAVFSGYSRTCPDDPKAMCYSATGTDAFAFSPLLYLACLVVSHDRANFWVFVFAAVAFFIARAFSVMFRHIDALWDYLYPNSMFALISDKHLDKPLSRHGKYIIMIWLSQEVHHICHIERGPLGRVFILS